MNDRCRRIETLAALLAASDEERLEAWAVLETGYWLREEARGLKVLLDAMGKETR